MHSLQTGTLAHLADILSSRGGAATRLKQQLGGIQQSLAVAVVAVVIVEVQVVVEGGVRVSARHLAVLLQPKERVLIARVVGLTLFKTFEEAEVENGSIAAQVALAELVVSLHAYGQEAPAVARHLGTIAHSPVVGRDERGQHGATDGQRAAPAALVAAILVVDFPDGFLRPFTLDVPDVGIVGIQGVVAGVDDLLHVLQSLRIACGVALIHHHFGIHHVAHGLRGASGIGVVPAQGEHLRVDDFLELTNEFGIHLVGLQLRSGVGSIEVFQIEGDVAEVVPQHVVVEHAHGAGLHLVVLGIGGCDVGAPGDVAQHVVATLDARVVDGPERGERVVLVALVVEEHVPVLHIVLGLAANPEVVALNFGIDVQRVVLSQSPVGPVDGVVSSNQGFLNVLVGLVVILKEVAAGVGHLKEIVAATGEQHTTGGEKTHCYIFCFHIL